MQRVSRIGEEWIGQKYNRLTVVGTFRHEKHRQTYWKLECECGKIIKTTPNKVLTGHTSSCGCMRREMILEKNYKHGGKGTRLFNVWLSMNQRCKLVDRNNKDYPLYVGKGITVCDEWKDDFNTFRQWALVNGYSEEILPSGINGLTIDRIDNSRGYSPDNCRFVPMSINGKNTDKVANSFKQVCRGAGKNYHTIMSRIYSGLSKEEALSIPIDIVQSQKSKQRFKRP